MLCKERYICEFIKASVLGYAKEGYNLRSACCYYKKNEIIRCIKEVIYWYCVSKFENGKGNNAPFCILEKLVLEAVDVHHTPEELDVYLSDYEVNNSFNHILDD